MAPVEILKFPISSPGDISPLLKLKEAGYDASQILAIVGKTEGNSTKRAHSTIVSARTSITKCNSQNPQAMDA